MFDRLSGAGKPISSQSQLIQCRCNTQVLAIVMTFLNNQFNKGIVFWQQYWVYNLRWALYFLVYSDPRPDYPTLITKEVEILNKFQRSSSTRIFQKFTFVPIVWSLSPFYQGDFGNVPRVRIGMFQSINKPENKSNNSQNFREFWKLLQIDNTLIIGFKLFPRVLVLCKMLSVSSTIWTRVAVPISYDDNHYTTGTSTKSE